ncbi:Putative predicted metal-dependent hydrolase [hydrothermal vent metagenome]|uniref:Predicted metal-dependent hydrolase n=1 Tax=hydrothermal vent metagenome TaxID=652676 RepID=A0A3B0WZ56_9ZZZZ
MQLKTDGQIQLSVPYHTKINVIEDFIVTKYQWIRNKQIEQSVQPKPVTLFYHDGAKHLYKGVEYPLRLIISNHTSVEINNNYINIFHRKNVSIKNILNKWYRQQSLQYFSQRTHLFSNSYNFPKVQAIKVRNMKARWGSCSSRAVITYNIHLLKANPAMIDYVIIHELCHLVHPNHSTRFYALQTQINPNWKQQKQLLNQQEHSFIPIRVMKK